MGTKAGRQCEEAGKRFTEKVLPHGRQLTLLGKAETASNIAEDLS